MLLQFELDKDVVKLYIVFERTGKFTAMALPALVAVLKNGACY